MKRLWKRYRSLNDLRYRLLFALRNAWDSRRNIRWCDDQQMAFCALLDKVRPAKMCFVFGNSPNLNLIDATDFTHIPISEVLRVGINRSFKRVPSEIILWTDCELWSEFSPEEIPSGTSLVRIARPHGHPPYIRWWIKHKSLVDWDRGGLFFLRNTLVSALHLCFLAEIKKIVLFGVSLDDAQHFYSNEKSGRGVASYEHHSQQYVDQVFYGYDIQRCVREIVEYMQKNEFDIRYVGESRFLEKLELKGYPDLPALKRDADMAPFFYKEQEYAKA